MCACQVCVYQLNVYVHLSCVQCLWRSDPVGLELEMAVSCLWFLGIEPGPSTRAATALNLSHLSTSSIIVLKSEFLCVALAVLELYLYIRLALNLQSSAYLCPLITGIKATTTWLIFLKKIYLFI